MKLSVVKEYIEAYKNNFQRINEMEIYKWKAIDTFRNNFYLNSDNISKMLELSLKDTKNLLTSTNYYPKKMLITNAEESPSEVKELLENLANQSIDRLTRINHFKVEFSKINEKNFPNLNHHYQDDRAIIAYLSLLYPNDNYFYKFNMFKDFAKKVNSSYIPIKGRTSNIPQFYSVCETVKNILIEDFDLLRLHNDRLHKYGYIEKEYNVLTQDFIYAVAKHLDVQYEVSESKKLDLYNFDFEIISKKTDFKANQNDYLRLARKNKIIGDLGEILVLEIEKKNIPLKYKNKIEHSSKSIGDGLGYDILSFDESGNKKYIEVKTTKGGPNTPFYITNNELEKSCIEGNKYYLYRVYNYNIDTESGDYFIIRGDLTAYCNNPIQYEVSLKRK